MLFESVSHGEQSAPDARVGRTRKSWKSLTSRGREITVNGAKAACKIAAAIRDHFQAKHKAKAAEHVAAEYGATARQARRWFVTGPTLPTFGLMLEREGPSLWERLSAAFVAPKADRPRRFRWRRAA